jgi:hypothetical protein
MYFIKNDSLFFLKFKNKKDDAKKMGHGFLTAFAMPGFG